MNRFKNIERLSARAPRGRWMRAIAFSSAMAIYFFV